MNEQIKSIILYDQQSLINILAPYNVVHLLIKNTICN